MMHSMWEFISLWSLFFLFFFCEVRFYFILLHMHLMCWMMSQHVVHLCIIFLSFAF